jgi:hypothetical protein
MRWDPNTKLAYHEVATQLVEWFDKRQRDFHEKYRLRAKIEALFSAPQESHERLRMVAW